MESFRCATCGNALTGPLRLVELPDGPPLSRMSHLRVNPPRLEPGTYATDPAPYGLEPETGTFVLSPGDVFGTRIIGELVEIGCWSLSGGIPCVACETCGELVAARCDDCNQAQETRLFPSVVVREKHADVDPAPDPFALVADWDDPPPETRWTRWIPEPTRPRPELAATRWSGPRLRDDLFRDDPPA